MQYKNLHLIRGDSQKQIDFQKASLNNNPVQLRIQKSFNSSDLKKQQDLQQSGWKNCMLPREVLFYKSLLCSEYELFDGDCCQLKMKNNPQEWIEKFIIDVGNGLQQIHQDHYIHIDLKPANIVYKIENNTYSFAICDFSSLLKVEETKIKECIGTPLYMPYEMNDENQIKQNGLTTAVDVWAFGVTLFELITSKDLLDQQTITKKGNQQFIDQQILTVQSLFYQNILKKLLQVDPSKRCTIKEFLEYFNGQKFQGNTISQVIFIPKPAPKPIAQSEPIIPKQGPQIPPLIPQPEPIIPKPAPKPIAQSEPIIPKQGPQIAPIIPKPAPKPIPQPEPINFDFIVLLTVKEFFSQYDYDYYMNEESEPDDFDHSEQLWTEESPCPY